MAEKTIRPASTAIGYLYVCMTNQNLEKNKADILQLADQHDLSRVRFAEEIASGKVFRQERKIPEALESIRPNEVIVVNELWRLGRSMLECTETLSIAAQKQTNVYALKGSWRLDQSIQSKILAMAFSMAAESNAISFRNGPRALCASRRAQNLKLGMPMVWQKQTRSVSSRDPGPVGQRLHPEIYRPALSCDKPTFTVGSKNTG